MILSKQKKTTIPFYLIIINNVIEHVHQFNFLDLYLIYFEINGLYRILRYMYINRKNCLKIIIENMQIGVRQRVFR